MKRVEDISNLIKFARSLGVNLGKPNLHWITQYLKLEYPDIKFEKYKIYSDPDHIVDDELDEFKVPVYSENPLIICGFISIVLNLEEAVRLVKIKEFLKQTKNQTVEQTYLFANAIEEEIIREVDKYCKDNGVILVNEEDF